MPKFKIKKTQNGFCYQQWNYISNIGSRSILTSIPPPSSKNPSLVAQKSLKEIPLTKLYLNIIPQQILGGAEIERHDVKANSKAKLVIRKGWIDNLVILVCEIPDFSFGITKYLK